MYDRIVAEQDAIIVRLSKRVAELEAECERLRGEARAWRDDRDMASKYLDEAIVRNQQLHARVTELEVALEGVQEIAEFWINRCAEPQMTKERYEVWLALGHRSAAMERARAALEGGEDSQ